MYCSPQRANKATLEDLRNKSQLNNVIALQIQTQLHRIFTHPQYDYMSTKIHAALWRTQGLAFDGYYETREDRERLIACIQEEKRQSNNEEIYTLLETILRNLEESIQQNEQHWKNTNYSGDLLRMHQDVDAVNIFATQFRGRLLFLGSARKTARSAEYDATRWISQTLVEGLVHEDGETEQVLTGAGPGTMEAGNEGAMLGRLNLLKKFGGLDAKSLGSETQRIIDTIRSAFVSVGLRIELPFEAGWNPYLQTNLTIKTFPARKLGMQMAASGRSISDDRETIIHHGKRPAIFTTTPGFGTADENWEALCAMQCGKMKPVIPFLVIGSAARHAMKLTLRTMQKQGTIDPNDLNLITFCRDEREAAEAYLAHYNITPSSEMQKTISERMPVMK